ncbi:hypothetical protein GQ53DRAFT_734599 [Thozetella sp. PMI_491]|nr:hypothetical protein GQ53DRAFT_734599 [Thozetella sp. PMI_491]
MSATTTATDVKTPERVEEGRWGRYHNPVAEPNLMRKIIAENCSMAGATAAVLLQIAQRGVGLGVSDHSGFTKQPVQRARRSFVYIYCMAFGTPEERRRITDATHRAHSRVKGPDYDANDPELQLWVAATMYWSLVASYEDVYGPLDEETADEVYQEFSVYATALHVPPGSWPTDRTAFRKYWDKTIASLEITEEAKAVAQDVLYPGKNLPWRLWLFAKLRGPINRITTTEMLPEAVRNEFGISSTLYTRTLYWATSLYSRALYPLLPEAVRHFAKNYYMQDFRARVARGAKL